MKKNLFAIIFIFTSAQLFAQSTDAINYQAVIRNSSDQLVKNTTIGIQISILQGSTNGSISYQEAHSAISNENGLINFAIGTGSSITGNYNSIDWSLKPYFISISLDLEGGSNYTHFSTTELHSVPYSFYAKTADKLTNPLEAENGLAINDNKIGLIDGNSVNNVKVWDGENWVNKSIAVSTSNTGGSIAFENRNPFLVLNYQIALTGTFPQRNSTQPYVGEIMLFAGDYAIPGFALCNGQLLPISQNTALYALIYDLYGGNGYTSFALPDLRGRSVVHMGSGLNLTPYFPGEKGGTEKITLTTQNLPSHNHSTVITFPAP